MKLILAIMSNDDSPAVSSALTKENYQVTRLATTGGFLRAGNTTLIVGTDDAASFQNKSKLTHSLHFLYDLYIIAQFLRTYTRR